MDDFVNTISEKNKQNIFQSVPLSWTNNIDVQKLLDVVVEILAEEYIDVVKNNPETFSRTQMNSD